MMSMLDGDYCWPPAFVSRGRDAMALQRYHPQTLRPLTNWHEYTHTIKHNHYQSAKSFNRRTRSRWSARTRWRIRGWTHPSPDDQHTIGLLRVGATELVSTWYDQKAGTPVEVLKAYQWQSETMALRLSFRTINEWNKLPRSVVMALFVIVLKIHLDHRYAKSHHQTMVQVRLIRCLSFV